MNGIHIAYDDHTAAIHQTATDLVQGLITQIHYLGVGRLHACARWAKPSAESLLKRPPSSYAPSERMASTLEPEIDTNGILTGWNLSLNLDHNIEVPATSTSSKKLPALKRYCDRPKLSQTLK